MGRLKVKLFAHYIYIYIFILYDALICYVILVAHAEVIFFKLFLFVERERHDL